MSTENQVASLTAAEKAQALQKGLKRLGRNRVAAMPVHTSLDLLDELEVLAESLVSDLGEKSQ